MASYANRGQNFEAMIEQANEAYLNQGVALIYKIPTPVKVLNNNGGTVTGFYEKKGAPDYMGVYDQGAICFDAKSTKVETRFDLKNLKKHQYTFMKNFSIAGGLAFVLVQFKTLDETYYLPLEKIREYEGYYLNEYSYEGRKSIPYDEIAIEEHKIEQQGLIALDYLSVIAEVLE